mgnify:CR=1 FL=1
MANKACNEVVTVANMPMTVFDMISAMQNKYADRVAFRYVEGKDTVVEKTYAQYVQDIRKATGYLQQELGEPKGKKIVILSRTNYEYGAVVFGTMMAGAVIVTLNQGKTWAELEHELGMVEPDLIFNDGIDYGYRAQLEALYGAQLRPMDAWIAAPEAEMVNRIDHEGLLMLMFTSGTTGRSKGVMLSEKNYFTACQMYIDGLKSVLDYEERLVPQYLDQTFSHFTLVPMFHLAGFICYFVYGIQGWTLNLCCDARDLRRDMSLMHSDAMSTPPVLVEMICNEVKRGHADRLNGLWNLSCSSAILDPAILSDLVKNGFYINQCYSMTELAGYGLLNVTQEGDHLRALGKPDGFCEVKVDETGEICVRTDGGKPFGLFGGYFRDEALTKKAWHDDLYHTGDTAYKDELGFLWYVGRVDDVIKSSGYRIGPFEVESALMEHPSVLECAVTGVPDPDRGFVVKATIVLARGYEGTPELTKELQNHVKKVTAPYKYPRIVEYVDELPKTISGKIRRVEIRKNDLEKHKADKPK